eukprot:2094094-Alexandrium_andersonii.AAC.1
MRSHIRFCTYALACVHAGCRVALCSPTWCRACVTACACTHLKVSRLQVLQLTRVLAGCQACAHPYIRARTQCMCPRMHTCIQAYTRACVYVSCMCVDGQVGESGCGFGCENG